MGYNKMRVDKEKTEKWDSDQTRDWVLSVLSCACHSMASMA